MTALLVLLPGMLVVGGLFAVVLAFRPQYARLDDALAALGEPQPAEGVSSVASNERIGAWWLKRRPAAVTAAQRRALELRGRSPERHYTVKLIAAGAGIALPLLVALVGGLTGVLDVTIPLLFVLVGGAVGFLVPDLLLRAEGDDLAADATESLLTFFDLVTLERLANQSATQSLHSAASLSDTIVFTQLRGALERARLEQRMPYAELKALGARLELPALVDLADVIRLDESGAALASTLRSRVRELRDAHTTQAKIEAQRISERMTIFMVFPSMIFGLIFLAAPILRLLST